MSWDRRCMECGGWLTDQGGRGKRGCVKCGARYSYAGGMLTPLAPPTQEGAGEDIEFFGESASGTFDDPRARQESRGGQKLSLYRNEVTFQDLFEGDPRRACLDTARGLKAVGLVREAAEYLVRTMDRERERELFYPGDHQDFSVLEEALEEALSGCPRSLANRLKKSLKLQQGRFLRAQSRAKPSPEVMAPFRARIGQTMGVFLGARESGPASIPEQRHLPLEGGKYLRCEAGVYRVGPPGGPRRKISLRAFHVRTRLVTVADYARFLEASGYPPHPLWGWRGLDMPNLPVVGVSWEDAMAYASHHGGRLPTEAEWLACLDYEEPLFRLPRLTWEILMDDAGDPGGPVMSQGVVLLGEGLPKTLRGYAGARRQIPWGEGRADTGFRIVLDP